MSTGLENSSNNRSFETAIEIMRKYRTLVKEIFGSTPEEVQETHEAMEGLTPAEIREAVKLYREKYK